MIALMHWMKKIPIGKLAERLVIDIHDLPSALSRLEAGDAVLVDDLFATAGEGTHTNEKLLSNVDDTLRVTGRGLIVATPRKSDKPTMNIELECFAWNPPVHPNDDPNLNACPSCANTWIGGTCHKCGWQPCSAFFVWMEGICLGVLALPWSSAQQHNEYLPFKAENAERTIAGQFKDNEQIPRLVMSLFDDEKFVEWMWICLNKPTMGDINTGIRFFYRGMLTDNQVERAAKWGFEQLGSVQRLETEYGKGETFAKKFEWFFGVGPNKGFLKIATKFYAE